MMRERARYREARDEKMEANTLVSIAEEIERVSSFNDQAITPEEQVVGLGYRLEAAKLFDSADAPLDGWKQRAAVLAYFKGFGREKVLELFGQERIREIKLAMRRFEQEILMYPSSISKVPRYISCERQVLAENERLGVYELGNDGADAVTDSGDGLGW